MLDDDDTEAMDESALKKMILQFEKRFSKNQEMRIKYSDTPEKLVFSVMPQLRIFYRVSLSYFVFVFESNCSSLTHDNMFQCRRFMESEVELNAMINEMHVIATVPELYNIVVDLNAVQSLLQLLGHENTGSP